ncbi:hypothetical protein [Euhalothece natronophila]|uniref:hypothetical protein n=1 Tax=Euhalothece natronophila TaxID=577489 RepID=UPI001C9950F3|nr:hypothetical protein [Euhalothece natronophila]
MMPKKTRLSLIAIATVAFFLSSCRSTEIEESSPETPDNSQSEENLSPLNVTDQEIRSGDEAIILEIDEIPNQIPVDRDTQFGASERFSEGSVAPNNSWLALVTSGAAHSAGWLVKPHTQQLQPATFQYGGNITIGPWSEDSQYVVFVEKGPAGDRTLTVVDRKQLGETVEESAMPVRTPNHEAQPPTEQIYEAVGWRNGRLLFQVNGDRWFFDPDTEEVQQKS